MASSSQLTHLQQEVVRLDAPGFKRFMLTTATAGVLVDLVLDRVPQLIDAKRNIAGVRLDPPEEISRTS